MRGGSRAAAEVHEGVRRDILNADARRLAATLARDLVRPIVELNMGAADAVSEDRVGTAG